MERQTQDITEILYIIALSRIKSVGNIIAGKLINHFGSAEMVFKELTGKMSQLEKIPKSTIENIISEKNTALDFARQEMEFIEKHGIKLFLKGDAAYPKRLAAYLDAPIILYGKGNMNLNPKYSVSIVGTRRYTEYGSQVTKKIVDDLAEYKGMQIVSGLANGIDTIAHNSALQRSLPTIGILGHGLKTIYPAVNRQLALKMLADGGVLTEYTTDIFADAHNFPKRNRIIAGMSDAVVVVEAYLKVGALITANVGMSYNKAVFAVPGKIGDKASEGCNNLLKDTRSHIVTSGHDIAMIMKWTEKPTNSKSKQIKLLLDLDQNEQLVVDALESGKECTIDELLSATKLNTGTISSLLLTMEFKGIVDCLPGKRYILSFS